MMRRNRSRAYLWGVVDFQPFALTPKRRPFPPFYTHCWRRWRRWQIQTVISGFITENNLQSLLRILFHNRPAPLYWKTQAKKKLYSYYRLFQNFFKQSFLFRHFRRLTLKREKFCSLWEGPLISKNVPVPEYGEIVISYVNNQEMSLDIFSLRYKNWGRRF